MFRLPTNAARRVLVALLVLAGVSLTAVVSTPSPALAAPNFKAPFPCGQRWTYDHHSAEVRQALDFVRADGGTTGGTPQVASAAGVARRYSQPSGAGNYIVIDHGGGWTTYYFHLSTYSVPDGAYVQQGQQIGITGSTGNSSGPHLHYEQLYNGVGQTIVINGVSLAPYPGQYNQKYLVSDNCGTPPPPAARYFGGSPTDFTGDGRDDVIAFTHSPLADAYVATSTGTSFTGTSVKWHDWFALNGETPLTGDVNGDGRDDIITFTHDTNADVYVALSTGTSFAGTAVKWHDYFSIAGEHPAVGDVNGDGRDDIITFTQGPASASDVIVALSTGTSFGAPQKWHDLFAVGTEQPRVGDINGDGKDDIVTFTCNTDADVYAATSTGSSFTGTTVKWHDFFCLNGEFPYLGDVNGDGRDDLIVFTKGTTNDIYVALSTGTTFGPSTKWHDYFGLNGETTL